MLNITNLYNNFVRIRINQKENLSQLGKLIRLFNISPGIAISKVLELFNRSRNYKRQKRRYLQNKTYSDIGIGKQEFTIHNSQFTIKESLIVSQIDVELILKKAGEILEHKFDLLGSCLKKVKRDSDINSENRHPNSIEQKKIRGLIDKDYELIDWQLDFKSGFSWDENTWYKDIKYGFIEGADIKIPWELGRMQHLQILAKANLITNYELRITNEIYKEENVNLYLREFENQILDFISSNPPGFGVQWASAMDVVIRAVNWIESYNIFNSIIKRRNEFTIKESVVESRKGEKIDSSLSSGMTGSFEYYFLRSIYEHGKHIIENLEWSSGMRGNHYLADITGLIYIAAFLPETDEINSWLNFGINELCNEILYQFNDDGSNFEASINYHFLSAEMVFPAMGLLLHLPQEKLIALEKQGSSYYNYALKRYCMQTGLWEFTIDKPQFTIEASDSESIQLETGIGKRELGNGDKEPGIKFNSMIWERLKRIHEFSATIINDEGIIPQIGDNDSGQLRITNYELRINGHLSKLNLMRDVIGQMGISIEDNNKKRFDDFGLYILEDKDIKMFVRCGSVGQKGKGGHSHNDQLSFEMFVGNKPVIVDPGTYNYTAYPMLRNEYRSTRMHNTMWIEGMEQNDWWEEITDDLFWIKKDKSRARKVEFSDTHFIGEHYGYGIPHKRELTINNSHFTINEKGRGIGKVESGNGKSELTIEKPEDGSQKPEGGIIELDNIMVTGIDFCELNKIKHISFHFAPGLKINKSNEGIVVIDTGDKLIELSCRDGKIICQPEVEKYYYSPGYGERVEAEKVMFSSARNKIEWKIEIKKQ
ncbi:MAG: alginate lyase family protein [Bacteroidetes bacterium]|nr:MAG: alginate lyase family protein [Bacteroidota bacterium]